MKTTTYRCLSTKCQSCQSTRDTRGIGEFQIHADGTETLINCPDCHRETPQQTEPEAIKAVMQSMQEGYLIIDEILFVAKTRFGITANHSTIREALRQLWNNGQVKYRKNRFGQDCFALI